MENIGEVLTTASIDCLKVISRNSCSLCRVGFTGFSDPFTYDAFWTTFCLTISWKTMSNLHLPLIWIGVSSTQFTSLVNQFRLNVVKWRGLCLGDSRGKRQKSLRSWGGRSVGRSGAIWNRARERGWARAQLFCLWPNSLWRLQFCQNHQGFCINAGNGRKQIFAQH